MTYDKILKSKLLIPGDLMKMGRWMLSGKLGEKIRRFICWSMGVGLLLTLMGCMAGITGPANSITTTTIASPQATNSPIGAPSAQPSTLTPTPGPSSTPSLPPIPTQVIISFDSNLDDIVSEERQCAYDVPYDPNQVVGPPPFISGDNFDYLIQLSGSSSRREDEKLYDKSYRISPDRKSILFLQRKLSVYGIDKKLIDEKEAPDYEDVNWLDNNQIIFENRINSTNQFFVWNLATHTIEFLDIRIFHNVMPYRYYSPTYLSTKVIFDPRLTFAAFLDQSEIAVVRNLLTQKTIWSNKISEFLNPPVWSPDGEKLAIGYFKSDDKQIVIDIITRDGKVTRWVEGKNTAIFPLHWEQNTSTSMIVSWSPNSRYLAFNDTQSFYILDTWNKLLKHTCLKNITPDWSPDSSRIMYYRNGDDKKTTTYILNVETMANMTLPDQILDLTSPYYWNDTLPINSVIPTSSLLVTPNIITATPIPPNPTVEPTQAPPSPPTTVAMGYKWIHPKDGMALDYVPGGQFIMGGSDFRRRLIVNLDAFWIDQTEVTNDMYSKCVSDNACQPPHDISSETRKVYYGDPQYANFPVINVDWVQATTYCKWAGRSLPSAKQWEKAARGTDGRINPWGNEKANDNLANFDASGIGDRDTVLVGSYPKGASPYGALDMAGNVAEWVANGVVNYDDQIRGGSWENGYIQSDEISGDYFDKYYWSSRVGFRCALSTGSLK